MKKKEIFRGSEKFILLSLSLVTLLSLSAFRMKRDYSSEPKLCPLHQSKFLDKNLKEEYLPYIPQLPPAEDFNVRTSSNFRNNRCWHIFCKDCDGGYIREDDEYGLCWSCECPWNYKCNKQTKNWENCWEPGIWKDNSWSRCENTGIYPGYFDRQYRKYFYLFSDYIEYLKENGNCFCYWPEKSQEAILINNTAYDLFKDIISSTNLSELSENKLKQQRFLDNERYHNLNLHGITISLVSHCFLYSDYKEICRDLQSYSEANFDHLSNSKIRGKLDNIRITLALLFKDLYKMCLEKHPSNRIQQDNFIVLGELGEISLSDLSNNDYLAKEFSFDKSNDFFDKPNIPKLTMVNPFHSLGFGMEVNSDVSVNIDNSELLAKNRMIFESNFLTEKGGILNDLLLYNDAIKVLTEAIKYDPINKDAYIERAMAYFETNQIELALRDYELIKKINHLNLLRQDFRAIPAVLYDDEDEDEGKNFKSIETVLYYPQSKLEFSKGLIVGTTIGAKDSTKEFIPTVFSSFRGILKGLWAFVCSPIEVSNELIEASYVLGEFISSHSTEECFHCVVPELKELSLTWNTLNDNSRGHKIGYIIGKYGVDVFAPVGAIKGINKVRALKRANTMLTLESCASSQVKKTKILEESANQAKVRISLADSTKSGKILVKNSNTHNHIMQKKHAWGKVINISGNVETDFSALVLLLEKEKIFSKAFLIGEPELFPKINPLIKKSVYEKSINGFTVHAEFETYIETGITFFQDGWVISK